MMGSSFDEAPSVDAEHRAERRAWTTPLVIVSEVKDATAKLISVGDSHSATVQFGS